MRWLWLTLISQAGVALGLALEVQRQLPSWGYDFSTLVVSVVVLNQLLVPVLCKIGTSD